MGVRKYQWILVQQFWGCRGTFRRLHPFWQRIEAVLLEGGVVYRHLSLGKVRSSGQAGTSGGEYHVILLIFGWLALIDDAGGVLSEFFHCHAEVLKLVVHTLLDAAIPEIITVAHPHRKVEPELEVGFIVAHPFNNAVPRHQPVVHSSFKGVV